MSAPQYHAPSLRLAGTASPHLCLRAFARATLALDDSRRQPTTIYNGLHLADRRHIPSLCHAPSGLGIFWLIPQGVALGWYVSPFQGFHQPWHKLPLSPDTEFRCNENDPAEPGAKPGRE